MKKLLVMAVLLGMSASAWMKRGSAVPAMLICSVNCWSSYASIARFTQLTVTLSGSGTQWVWPERRIDRVLM